MKTKLLLLLLCFSVFQNLHADNYGFAVSLYNEGDYYRAIGEFKRYLFNNPSGKNNNRAVFGIGMSYLNADKNTEAAEWFSDRSDNSDEKDLFLYAVAISEAYRKKGDYNYSLSVLTPYKDKKLNNKESQELNYLLAWNNIYQGDFSGATKIFSSIDAPVLKESSLDIISKLNNSGNLHFKSPFLAGILSLVPGLGHFYCGKIVEGISSLLLVSYLAYNTYEGVINHDITRSLTNGIPGTTIYLAGIYGSVNAAGLYNSAVKKEFTKELEIFRINILEANIKF